MIMDLRRVEELIAQFRHLRILVVGDLMLDRYLYGGVDRISPEAPVPVVRVTSEKKMPGGGANVAANLRCLGAKVDVAGAIGDDSAGKDLLSALHELGIGVRYVVRNSGLPTTVKMRIVAERQQVVRVDWERPASGSCPYSSGVLARLIRAVRGFDGLIFADYGKGGVELPLITPLLEAARQAGIPTALDPKDNHCLRIRGITLATPNCKEAHACSGLPPRTHIPGNPLRDPGLRRATRALQRLWDPAMLMITLGAQGIYLSPKGAKPELIPTRAREVFDVSGAGDTVIATSLLALAAGATYHEAALLGNCAAGVVVGKLGTASCAPDELLQAMSGHQPEE
jgi:D-beta-D-heptose 7-phosphate kinase/D-beta-D-heptose 1-phosphate adenosyltransferase